MEVKNAVISGASLNFKERDILEVWLNLDYGGLAQGFGGYALYLPKSFQNHELKSVAGHFIYRCMEIAGVEDWKDIVGSAIRVQASENMVHAIGHIIKDDWFNPSEDFK